MTREKPQPAKAVPDPAEQKIAKSLERTAAETRRGSLKNGNAPGDFTKAARCGAKTRCPATGRYPVTDRGRKTELAKSNLHACPPL